LLYTPSRSPRRCSRFCPFQHIARRTLHKCGRSLKCTEKDCAIFEFPLGIPAEADAIIKVAATEADTIYFIVSLQLFRPHKHLRRLTPALSQAFWSRQYCSTLGI